ncbi:hypothetical protein [Aequorivita marisscotiae]|uniref:Uncharacterized protein n=1 Tax=Aequorivita marisscotiae TaxID=3040348 RepID=A0ABY8KXD0_9FLAO|nr:hypothetical protein [Aequorivita sp. Ant34-E75]WGF94039.1 hypothetical protein QCQ61_07555 [Aequorivita sp. Ant34-E75]
MKLKLTIIILIISFNLFGQSNLKKVDLNENYSWQNHSEEEINEYYFGLKPITKSVTKYHFRYIKTGQIIDLTSNDGIEFTGQLINETTEYKSIKTEYGNDSKANNYVYEIKEINKTNSTKVGQYIIKQKTYLIPTDSLISNWSFDWLDCFGIGLNYKVNNKIYLKSYTCPWNQIDTLKYVSQIKNTYKYINQTLDLEKEYSKFTNKLEKGKSYSKDSYTMMYIMTDKENEGWRKGKPIRDYKKSIKDTIDNYLETKLNQLIPNSTELNCYDDYSLTFSKRGKLKSMKVDMGFWERLFDKDYKKCKRILKKAFKEIKIDFVDPKYEFNRELSFGQKGIYIYDRMVY